jgi:hypothetical protein
MADVKYATTTPLIAVESDPCPKCLGPMTLARIMPGRMNFDVRTFECVRCDHVEKVLVPSDPMRSSNALGWLVSELRSPT